MSLHQIIKEINEEGARASVMRIGKILKHPDGRKVKITKGCYLDPIYGRVSNVWCWREIKSNGKLGKEESGYGW